MGCKRILYALDPGWDSLKERIEYEMVKRNRRVAAVKWFSLGMSLTAFVAYGIVTA